MLLLGFSFWSRYGSHSSDISGVENIENPLPPCPGSPNCVRITKRIDRPVDQVFTASRQVLELMKPEHINVSEQNQRIETVFRVIFFRDDMVLQLTERDSASTYLHIRSASRLGYTDLGVNRRRVKKFLAALHDQLSC